MSLQMIFVPGLQVPTPPTFSHVLVISPAGNSPSSQRKFTIEPNEKGGVPILTSTLPLDGAAGEPQVMAERKKFCSNSHYSDYHNT